MGFPRVGLVFLVVGWIVAAGDARGDLILDRTWSGADLFNDPAVSLPTGPPVLNGTAVDFNGSFLGSSGVADGAALDRTGALSFSFWGNQPEELDRIHCLRIRVEGLAAVPEPSSLISAALGLVVLGGYAGLRRLCTRRR